MPKLGLGFAMLLASTCIATAETMTFDDVSGNYTDFDQTLGDITDLDVSNRTRTGFGNSTIYSENLDHWEDNYSELVDVAFPTYNGGVGELEFAPAAGSEVLISSFDFGNYFNGSTARDAVFRIYDDAWNLVWELLIDNHTGNSVNVMPDIILANGGYFQWGIDWNVGIDNFTYSVRPDSVASPVPLPAAGWLMLAGLGALVAGRRSRR